jgi:hypothetical protein
VLDLLQLQLQRHAAMLPCCHTYRLLLLLPAVAGPGSLNHPLVPCGLLLLSHTTQHRWDVSKLEPLVAAPHSPDNRKTARECSDVKIDRVYIGSCTGV